LLATAVAPRTGKNIKNRLCVFEKGEKLLQYGVQHFLIGQAHHQESRFKVKTCLGERNSYKTMAGVKGLNN